MSQFEEQRLQDKRGSIGAIINSNVEVHKPEKCTKVSRWKKIFDRITLPFDLICLLVLTIVDDKECEDS